MKRKLIQDNIYIVNGQRLLIWSIGKIEVIIFNLESRNKYTVNRQELETKLGIKG